MKSTISSRTRSLSVLIGLLISIVISSAASIIDLTYLANGETVTITDCDQNASGTLEIPTEIEGKRVSTIGTAAFAECGRLTKITIPESITSIGNRTFFFCSSLTSINIPSSLTAIGDGVFALCESLTSIDIPDSVTSIGNGAFGECYSLKTITIPNSVVSIGNRTFANCISLARITIPSSVTCLGSETFHGCAKLKSIVFQGDAPTTRDKIPTSPPLQGWIPLDPPPNAIVTVQPSATGFGASFRSLPVVIVALPLSITNVSIDAEGNYRLKLSGSNTGLKLFFSPHIHSEFTELSETATQGENEILILSSTAELQKSHGFFRLSN